MAPSRGKGKAAAISTPRASRRTTRAQTRQPADDGVPEVFSIMLSEAHTDGEDDGDRPLKKRRITPRKPDKNEVTAAPASRITNSQKPGSSAQPVDRKAQTVEDSSESDGNELDFEDVDIDQPLELENDSAGGIEDLSISVQPESSTPSKARSRNKPIGTIEKTHRLLVHKLHVLCLLGHCMFVNGRCNNATAQRHLRSILSSKTISYLNPSKQETQFQRNRSFTDGLEQAVSAFTADYRTTSSGLKKPHWTVDGEVQQTSDSAPLPSDSSDFIAAAQSLEGSQDTANQLFCAMLRSAGVDARIVCSVQALPFSSVPKAATPKKPAKVRFTAMPPYHDPAGSHTSEDDAAVSSSRVIGKVPSARRRLGQPTFAAEPTQPSIAQKKAPVVKLSYPVFWVEAFNEASQKWVAVDPIVTHTIGKPAKIEPPASYNLNQLTYAIAFEDDGSARDVTRRYAKAYNAKTRRHRVEAAIDGTRWCIQVMRVFRRPGGLLDRDQVEDAELAQKEAREGLPANVLDFKDHPYYALERHLKRHEVIHPKREVGKVNTGTAARSKMELVYRRRDVLSCKSADKWYRSGREIKAGEQPLKHVPAKARRQASPEHDNRGPENVATTALYAPHQTQLYVPPTVQHGRIPKNMYGNLDIYVPSMIPAGGVHIRHALTQQAAKLLRIDYADAVTGFQFKGRHGTAIVEGAVVASQYVDAVHATIAGMEFEASQDASRSRSLRALKTWEKFLTGLRIAERVRAYGDPSTAEPAQADDADELMFASMAATDPDEELLTAGRLSLKELERKKPSTRKRKTVSSDSEEDFEDDYMHDEGGGFLVESDGTQADDQGGFLPDADDSGLFAEHDHEDNGGGFVVEDIAEAQDGGGFVVEDSIEAQGEGGFLPECNSNEAGDGNGVIAQSVDEETVGDGFAGGFLPDSDHVEDRNESRGGFDLQDEFTANIELDEGNGSMQADNNTKSDIVVPEKQDHLIDVTREIPTALGANVGHEMKSQTEPYIEATARATGSISTRKLSNAEEASLANDESDKGSMLSHDPEDEELEPDWLESD